MKPVFKCDYCTFMGTEDEVRIHEENCTENHTKKNCYTCIHKGKISMVEGNIKYECKKGKDIPVGHIINYCDMYEQVEKSKYTNDLFSRNLFGGFF